MKTQSAIIGKVPSARRIIYDPLNDACWSSVEVKTEAMSPLIAAFKDWQAWDESHIKWTVEQIVIQTVKRIIAEMDYLPEKIRIQCRNVFSTMTALKAAQTAWDLDAIEDCARMKQGEPAAIRKAKWATVEAAEKVSWAASEAGWGAKRAGESTSSAASAARAAVAEKVNPDNILHIVCQLWIEAAKP